MTHFGLLTFKDMTQLDLTAPYEVFCACPEARVDLIAMSSDPVVTEHGLLLQPTARLADIDRLDVLCIPGGQGVNPLLNDEAVLAHIRRLAATATYVTSVCTGALVLGAAGLLQGKAATTHWAATAMLPCFGVIPTAGRYVQDGRYVTGGGITAGIDFALHLAGVMYGTAVAERIQLALEYNPAPPFNAGHPDQALPTLTESLLERMAPRLAIRWAAVRRAAARLDAEQAGTP